MRTNYYLALILIYILILSSCYPVSSTSNLSPTITSSTASFEATTGLQSGGSIAIHSIQGVGHISAYNGQLVKDVRGVVTAIRADGFYIQDTQPDNNPATSEGILVFTVSTPNVRIGDEVLVTGTVDEYYPGGITTGNLSITEVKNPFVKVVTNGKPLPEAVVVGKGGRIPPTQIIDDDRMEKFEPGLDGLDFYESLESMLVMVNNAIVVGPTNSYKEIVVIPDDGQGAGLRSSRGGIVVQENDYNPERIMIDDLLAILPDVNVGDRFDKPLVGVMDYNFGNYRILVKQRPIVKIGGLQPAVAPTVNDDEFSICGINVQNLDPGDGQKRFDDLAKIIVKHLNSPDIVSLEEVQDNNGIVDGIVVDASETYKLIIRAIQANDGPKYEYSDISPEANQDGGEIGGNIRVGFLYRTDKKISFIQVVGGGARNAVGIRLGEKGIELTSNPGRIDPSNAAYLDSRKPLIAQFEVNGNRIFLIGLHLNSKGGDTALYGRYQPPVLSSETQRIKQAESINNFVNKMLQLDPNAKIILLGDFNDFQFSNPIRKLLGGSLINLVTTLPMEKQYSYIYEGNGQVLDHILISPGLKGSVTFFDFIHLNSEFAVTRRLSDHDPTFAKFKIP